MPTAYLNIAIYLAIAAFGFYGGMRWNADEVAKLQMDYAEERSQLLIDSAKALAAKQVAIDRGYTKYREAQNVTDEKTNALQTVINSDKSVLVRLCESGMREAGDTARLDAEARTDSIRRIESTLIAIAARCDRNTNQLNGLIDAVAK